MAEEEDPNAKRAFPKRNSVKFPLLVSHYDFLLLLILDLVSRRLPASFVNSFPILAVDIGLGFIDLGYRGPGYPPSSEFPEVW